MSKQLDLDFNSTVTISTPTSTYTMCDSDNYTWGTDSITVTTGIDNSKYSTITGYDDVTLNTGNLFEDLPVMVGKYELTEKSLEKVFAVIDIFENDDELKDVLKTQIALNRIKNETKSN